MENKATVVEELPEIDDLSTGWAGSPIATRSDPFLAEGDELKKFHGVDAATKKRISRTINKQYTGQGDAETKQTEQGAFSAYDAFDCVMPDYNLEYLAKIYEISSPNFAACNVKAANIVGLGYDFVPTQKMKDALEDADTIEKQEKMRKKLGRVKEQLNEALEDFNYEDTFSEILLKVWIDYESTGNGYLEIGRTDSGKIGYVGHIPSVTMRVRRPRDGYVQVMGPVTTFFRNFGKQDKDPINKDRKPNEIIHIKKYTPTNTFYGIPDIISAKQALAGDEFASRYNLDYFEFKAVPRYVITVKGAQLSNKAQQKLHEFFTTGLQGKNHRTLYVPLPADSAESRVEFKMEAVENKTQEASFINYQKFNRDAILQSHRVPITKVSVVEGVALAASRDADKTFKETVARPEQDKFEKKINLIIKEMTDAFTFKLNELALTDEDTQSTIDERDVRSAILTPNEIRARRGYGPVEHGDQPPVMTAQQMADEAAQQRDNDKRAQERSAGATDSRGEGRNTQGEGRSTQ